MSAKRLCLIALLTATLTGGKLAIPIHNVEIVTLLLIVYALSFRRSDAIIACVLFVSIEPMIHGFNPMWIVLYFVYYPSLVVVISLLPKNKARIPMAVTVGIVATFLFGVIDAIINRTLFGALGSGRFFEYVYWYYAAGIPFVLTHIICNAVVLPALVPVMAKALGIMRSRYESQNIINSPEVFDASAENGEKACMQH